MRKNVVTGLGFVVLSAGIVQAGGWEASRLSTGIMYEGGGRAELSTQSISYNVNAAIQSGAPAAKKASDQNRTSLGLKADFGDIDFGIFSYRSGAIQLSGQEVNATNGCDPTTVAVGLCSVVPSADADLNSTVALLRYSISDNFSVIGGANRYSVSDGSVQTLAGLYSGISGETTVPLVGAAYEISDIALRVEVLAQGSGSMDLDVTSSVGLFSAATSGGTLGIPSTLTLNAQSGIAEDTLAFVTVHRAEWDDAQIAIPANGPVAEVGSNFSTKTSYTVGLGRKFTDELSGLISYSTEEGGGANSNDPFTLSNGTQTISVGLSYKLDNMTVSGGYSYTKVGDVSVTHLDSSGNPSGLTASYSDNSVSGFGFKIGFAF